MAIRLESVSGADQVPLLPRSPKPIRNRVAHQLGRLSPDIRARIAAKKPHIGKLLVKGTRSFISAGVGSGILISETYFLTSRHGMVYGRDMAVRFEVYHRWSLGKTFPVVGVLDLSSDVARGLGVRFDENSDLIVLELGCDSLGRFPGENNNFTGLTSPEIPVGDSLHFLGYTSGTSLKVSDMWGSPLELSRAILEDVNLEGRCLVWHDWDTQAQILAVGPRSTDSVLIRAKSLASGHQEYVFEVRDGKVYRSDGRLATRKQDFFVLMPISQKGSYIQLSHRIAPGSSGGIYFDDDGHLVAVHCGRIPSDRTYPNHIAISPYMLSQLSDIPDGLLLEGKDQLWAAFIKKKGLQVKHVVVEFLDFTYGKESIAQLRVAFQDDQINLTLEAYGRISGVDIDRLTEARTLFKKGGALSKSDCVLLIQHLNFFSQEVEFEQTRGLDLTQVKVGTEFTFCNDDTRKLINVEFLKQLPAPILNLMEKWRNAVVALHTKDKGFKVTRIHFGFEFEYTLSTKAKWWWRMGVDESCIELQMCPTPYAVFRDRDSEIASIINRDIFEMASGCGLHPDPTDAGGGGHLSLDLAGLCGRSVRRYMDLLKGLQAQSMQWPIAYPLGDELNAPWLCDQGTGLRDFNSKILNLEKVYYLGKLSLGAGCAEIFSDGGKEIEAFFKTVNYPKAKAVRSVHQNPLHYQAVNIQHVTTSKPEERRIEFRRIPAQTDYANFVLHLEALMEYVRLSLG